MKKAFILFAILALTVGTAMAERSMIRPQQPQYGHSQDRDVVELGYDDDSFEGFGTSPDWTDETVMVAEVPAGGPYTLETVRIYGYGLNDRPVVFREVADLGSEPGAIIDNSILFNWGTDLQEEAHWVDVDVSELGYVYDEGDLICAGCTFDGTDAIGLDDSCAMMGTCGVYWAMWSGMWTLDSDYGYNDGIRFVLTGGTATKELTISGVKRLY